MDRKYDEVLVARDGRARRRVPDLRLASARMAAERSSSPRSASSPSRACSRAGGRDRGRRLRRLLPLGPPGVQRAGHARRRSVDRDGGDRERDRARAVRRDGHADAAPAGPEARARDGHARPAERRAARVRRRDRRRPPRRVRAVRRGRARPARAGAAARRGPRAARRAVGRRVPARADPAAADPGVGGGALAQPAAGARGRRAGTACSRSSCRDRRRWPSWSPRCAPSATARSSS